MDQNPITQKERRLQFQAELETICPNVYFQPPETMKLQFPCIVYFKTNVMVLRANNNVYKNSQSYTVTYVTKDPDSEVPFDILRHFKYTKIDSFYKSENMNHTKLTIFY